MKTSFSESSPRASEPAAQSLSGLSARRAARPLQGIILDVDGTLVDSNRAHTLAWADAFSGVGLNLPIERIRRAIGMGSDHLLPALTGQSADSPWGHHVVEIKQRIFRTKYASMVRPFPHVADLLRRMRREGLQLAIATSASAQDVLGILTRADLAELVDFKVSQNDVEDSKPDPDLVSEARHRLGFEREEVLMVGDTPYDVESARRAGVAAIAFRCGGWADRDLAGALAIFDDPEDLWRNYENSPLAGALLQEERARP